MTKAWHRTGKGLGGAGSMNPNRKRAIAAKSKSGALRDRSTVKRLNMYRGGGPIRNTKGRIIKGGDLCSSDKTGNKDMVSMARIAPDRRWFGNTRVVGQRQLETFRSQIKEKAADPYAMIIRSKQLPMALLEDPRSKGQTNNNMLGTQSFGSTFGPKKTRKRPKLKANSLAELSKTVQAKVDTFEAGYKGNGEDDGMRLAGEEIFRKGQSKRIWTELYKVLDCSDVVVQVIDARDPMGTRSKRVEQHLKKNAKHKHLILLLNKVDLVPAWSVRAWVRKFSAEYPTLAFHAHMTKPFGKGALIQLLRQFAILHPEKKQISVGFVGYPNAGKSSVINTIKSKKVCKVAPIPGETKIWQYITLFKRVFLIDCPGVVYASNDSESEIVMKGVVRGEKLENPDDYVPAILERVKTDYIKRTYGIESWTDAVDFLKQMARKSGRMLKGGEPDLRTVAQRVIYDFQRGKLPHFVPPPMDESSKELPATEAEASSAAAAHPVAAEPSDDCQYAPDQDFSALPQSEEAIELDKSKGQQQKAAAQSNNDSASWDDLDLDD